MRKFDTEKINTLIQTRRSVFPGFYNDEEIPIDVINQILENANWAPNHRKTEPWRFIVFRGESRRPLADYMQNWYVQNTSEADFKQKKFEKIPRNIMKTPCIIAICMARDPDQRVPEWEELAAVACAVQNMWLTAHAYQIGSYWSSPRSIIEADDFLGLDDLTTCLGLFYMGYYTHSDFPAARNPIQEKVQWRD